MVHLRDNSDEWMIRGSEFAFAEWTCELNVLELFLVEVSSDNQMTNDKVWNSAFSKRLHRNKVVPAKFLTKYLVDQTMTQRWCLFVSLRLTYDGDLKISNSRISMVERLINRIFFPMFKHQNSLFKGMPMHCNGRIFLECSCLKVDSIDSLLFVPVFVAVTFETWMDSMNWVMKPDNCWRIWINVKIELLKFNLLDQRRSQVSSLETVLKVSCSTQWSSQTST
jgi:hypothetical protein